MRRSVGRGWEKGRERASPACPIQEAGWGAKSPGRGRAPSTLALLGREPASHGPGPDAAPQSLLP